ncbi:ubiquinol oxidase subunit II [Piscinibacter sakaiensis]|uniref:Ubiquinol oxidase polypeptide II n=1 Tax=Piscinibacter sakaiensis TaxID=1547922 RepID=A0A0K8NYI3_PISS1|nr:ubiquinol oxidase subunit II [Piscinibacter sakaiensis]GAP35462.1 cytochrome O ubiquinol oxidase, subunit II [Piscinibacter sakaiensis]
MTAPTLFRRLLRGLLLLPLLALGGCGTVVLNASGDIARQQGQLIVVATVLMLLIIVPVIVLTFVFAWRYRAANTQADYRPDWDHSTQLELVIWAAPLLIIIALGAVTWISTHTLDPYRPLSRLDAQRPLPAGTQPLVVEVVAMDWKWLFLYPEQGIATVNELAAPVDRPIRFHITSTSVMNSFFVPALAGQIYAMPGMQTQLHAVINRAGVYDGFSANFSGDGFSQMRFRFHGLSDADFAQWVARARADGGTLDRGVYLQLERPSAREPVRRFGRVDPALYHAILNRCVEPGKMCMHQMMAIDAAGGLGLAGAAARSDGGWRLAELGAGGALGDAPRRVGPFVQGLCTPQNTLGAAALAEAPGPATGADSAAPIGPLSLATEPASRLP